MSLEGARNEGPCFFEVGLTVLWKQSCKRGFFGEGASSIVSRGEVVNLSRKKEVSRGWKSQGVVAGEEMSAYLPFVYVIRIPRLLLLMSGGHRDFQVKSTGLLESPTNDADIPSSTIKF